MRASNGAAVFAVCCSLGCGTEVNVELEASIQNPNVRVEQLTLGTQLTGGFDLELELGAEAPSGTTVSLQRFELLGAEGASLAPLAVRSNGAAFPLHVDKGQRTSVPFVFDDSELLASEVKTAVCAGPVRIAGAITDTLGSGSTTPLTSATVAPEGC